MTFAGSDGPRFVGIKVDVSTVYVVGKERVSHHLPCSIQVSNYTVAQKI